MAIQKDRLSQCLQEALASGEEKTIAELQKELIKNPVVRQHQLLRYPDTDTRSSEANNKRIRRLLNNLMQLDFPDKQYIRNDQQKPATFRAEAKYSSNDNPHSLVDADFSVAVSLALNDKFASTYMPSEYYRQFTEEVRPGSLPPDVQDKLGQLVRRIAVMQRSKSLQPASPFPREQLDKIYQALLEYRKIGMQYRGDEYMLLPIGVVFRDPKIFLVGKVEKPADKVKVYSVNKITNLWLDEPFNPNGLITLDDYLATDAMDFGPREFAGRQHVVLEIIAGNDNLLLDIQQHKLSNRQKSKKLPNGNLQITLPDEKISYQLMEWIVGRMERVVVKQPPALKDYLRERLEMMLENYR